MSEQNDTSLIVGVDARPANQQKRVGISNLCFEILRAMISKNDNVLFRLYIDASPLPDMPTETVNVETVVLPACTFWTQRALARELRHNPPDVFWSASIQIPLLCATRRVPTVLDLAYFDFASDFPFLFRTSSRLQTRLALWLGAHFIVISKSTLQDCLRRFARAESDYTVAHLGVSPRFVPCRDPSRIRQVRNKFNLHNPFVLYVGTLQPRKNLARLIGAFSRVLERRPELPHEMVIVGGKGWMFEDIYESAKNSAAATRIRFLDFVPDDELPALISEAELLALVSLWEGFGLPVVESMACGTPVVTSNCSSLPEIAGDAAILIDPYDVSAIAAGLETLLLDNDLRAEYQQRGLARAAQFNWDTTAQIILHALRQAVPEKP